MGTLKKEPVGREKGPDVVGALRDWVGSDHRIASTTESEESDPDRNRTLASAESSHQEDPARPAQNLPDADAGGSSASAESGYQGDPAQSAHDLSAGEAGDSWASAHQNPYDFHVAPPIQGHFPDPHHVNFLGDVSDGGVVNRPVRTATARSRSHAPEPLRAFSVTRRVADTLAYGLVTIAVVAVLVAFLSNDNLRLGGSNRYANQSLSAGSLTSESNPVPQQQLATQRQLETIANDLASVQRTLERLAARQDKMERNIATLQASEQNQVTTLSQAAVPIPSARPRRHRRSR